MQRIKSILFFFPKLIALVHNRFFLKFKNVEYTTYPKISGKLFITGRGKLYLGSNVKFNSSRESNPIGGDTKMIIDLGLTGALFIGDNSGMSNATLIAHEKIEIGSNVKIGGSVKMYDTDFHSIDPKKRQNPHTDIPNRKAIVIGDNAFIGAHSIILKGVVIGQNTIIGAGSVVTKSVPANEIWAGNPAKFIKKIEESN